MALAANRSLTNCRPWCSQRSAGVISQPARQISGPAKIQERLGEGLQLLQAEPVHAFKELLQLMRQHHNHRHVLNLGMLLQKNESSGLPTGGERPPCCASAPPGAPPAARPCRSRCPAAKTSHRGCGSQR
jgi:hypothetical protein